MEHLKCVMNIIPWCIVLTTKQISNQESLCLVTYLFLLYCKHVKAERVGILSMEKYEMTLNKGMKEISIKVRGMYEPDDAKRFVEDFIKLVSTIQTSEFLLWFDAEELKVSNQAMVPVLEGSFKMYKKLGFKKIVTTVGSNVALKKQLKKIGITVGLDIEIF